VFSRHPLKRQDSTNVTAMRPPYFYNPDGSRKLADVSAVIGPAARAASLTRYGRNWSHETNDHPGCASLSLHPDPRERLRHMIDERPHCRGQAAARGEDEVDDAHLAAPAGEDADEAAGAQIVAADMIGQ